MVCLQCALVLTTRFFIWSFTGLPRRERASEHSIFSVDILHPNLNVKCYSRAAVFLIAN